MQHKAPRVPQDCLTSLHKAGPTLRMPLPPPPQDAFSMMGYPMRAHRSRGLLQAVHARLLVQLLLQRSNPRISILK